MDDFSFNDPNAFEDEPWRPEPSLAKLTRERFVWTDKEGNKHKLKDIDDQYLQNIINWLCGRLPLMSRIMFDYWSVVGGFLLYEQKLRADERKEGVTNGI